MEVMILLLIPVMLSAGASADSQYNTFHYANHPYIKYMGHHPGYVVTTPKPEMKHDMKEMKEPAHMMMKPMKEEPKPPMHMHDMPYHHAPAHHHQYAPPVQPYHHQPYHAPQPYHHPVAHEPTYAMPYHHAMPYHAPKPAPYHPPMMAYGYGHAAPYHPPAPHHPMAYGPQYHHYQAPHYGHHQQPYHAPMHPANKAPMMKDEEMMMDDHHMMMKHEEPVKAVAPASHHDKNPKYLGRFSKATHNVEGDIFLLDERTIYIQGFSFDGQAPDVHFWSDGVAIPYYTRTDPHVTMVVGEYNKEDVVLMLPPEKPTIKDLKHFQVWCRQYGINFGEFSMENAAIHV